MSSTTPPPPSPTQSGPVITGLFSVDPSTTQTASSGGGGGGGGGGGASSSLYLFTFLATLLLLLCVSSAIILRSFLLRRRFRRRVEEAILAGVLAPGDLPASYGRRRNFGEKPKMWEAHVAMPAGERWEDIMPISALPIFRETAAPLATATPTTPASDPSTPPQQQPPSRTPLYRRLLRNPFSHPTSPSSPASTPPPEPLPERPDGMQVSVFISMPDARRPHGPGAVNAKGKLKSIHSDVEEEEELPEMVLGVAELPYRAEGPGGVS